jgi:hypothetical protein
VTPTFDGASRQTVSDPLRCAADDLLLVDWLNALVCEWHAHAVFGIEVAIDARRRRRPGENHRSDRHEPSKSKRNYTALRMSREPDGRWSQCIVDV